VNQFRLSLHLATHVAIVKCNIVESIWAITYN